MIFEQIDFSYVTLDNFVYHLSILNRECSVFTEQHYFEESYHFINFEKHLGVQMFLY